MEENKPTGKIELDPEAFADPMTGVQPVAASLEATLVKADGTRIELGVLAEWHAEEEQ